MKLSHDFHLAYCTNIHRGESWAQTFDTLQKYTLAVRNRISPDRPYAIGLRLGAEAARELSDPTALKTFRSWLDRENCYVFTINGFPYGRFHGARVKELADLAAPWPNYRTVRWLLAVKEGSPFAKVADLKGRRIAQSRASTLTAPEPMPRSPESVPATNIRVEAAGTPCTW